MPLARHVFIWEEDGRLHARLQTNVSPARLRKALAARGHERLLDAVEQHDDVLRLNGGSYLIARFAEGVSRDELQRVLDAIV